MRDGSGDAVSAVSGEEYIYGHCCLSLVIMIDLYTSNNSNASTPERVALLNGEGFRPSMGQLTWDPIIPCGFSGDASSAASAFSTWP